MPSHEIESLADRWRYCCPRGHTSWQAGADGFWCRACSSGRGQRSHYDELRDRKTGERVSREEIEIGRGL